MSCDQYHDALADLVDGGLDADGRRVLDRHLSTCADCRALVADLRRISQTAATLDRLNPEPAVWTRIADGLRAEDKSPRHQTRSWRVGLAAAATILLAAAGGLLLKTWPADQTLQPMAGAGTQPATVAGRSVLTAKDVQSVEIELRLAAEHYEKAIAGLEAITKTEQTTLDPQLAATLQKNLAVIDQAIGESRAALREQPASRPAQESLFEAFRNKVTLLQETVALVNEMRKGNQAETARIVGGLSR